MKTLVSIRLHHTGPTSQQAISELWLKNYLNKQPTLMSNTTSIRVSSWTTRKCSQTNAC